MSNVIYVPLKPIPSRYTGVMDEEIEPHVQRVIRPRTGEVQELALDEFLSPVSTVQWQALQLAEIAELIEQGKVRSGDVLLFADMWFAGLETVRYMLDSRRLNVCIAGWNHAGRADPSDAVQQCGVWAEHAEMARHAVTDLVFVGSEFHQHRVAAYFRRPLSSVAVVGEVWSTEYVHRTMATELESIPFTRRTVIWPHRLCVEKGMQEFFAIAEAMPDWQFIVTSSAAGKKLPVVASGAPANVFLRTGLTKGSYFQLMRTGIYLSTAIQETFGYTLHEAIAVGARIVAPRRASYREFLPDAAMYTDVAGAVRLIRAGGTLLDLQLASRWDGNAKRAIELAKSFI